MAGGLEALKSEETRPSFNNLEAQSIGRRN